ncbi:GGDEF domain-containing protein [Deinococcus roseus]|uniref:GGDEF domain-containing protein n=1 Tax=Deinococcus roseus TaxID=392414 RepID=A0ABQ2D6U7_9DEIO|nr:GGDEF domain-containing protein [Deinococcus roseus]GGJ45646.1 hypothetical protein GCM10008938_34960 [Deinococcus roseus]
MFDAAVIRRRIYLLLGILVTLGGVVAAYTLQFSVEVQNVSQTLLGLGAAVLLGFFLRNRIALKTLEHVSMGLFIVFWLSRFLVEILSPVYVLGSLPLRSDTGLIILTLMVFIALPVLTAMRIAQGLYLVFICFPWLVLMLVPERRGMLMLDDFLRTQLITSVIVGLVYVLGVYKEQWVREHERNHWLHQIAYTDLLTGALNRRRLYEVLETQLTESRFSVILFDLDHFKRINDRYGHATGDEVLKRASEKAREVLRQHDHLGRWGGEEFLILLPSTSLEEAQKVAEQIRESFLTSAVQDLQGFSASFGVAEHAPQESHDALIHRADQALYQAKANGRNCVVRFGEHFQLSGAG